MALASVTMGTKGAAEIAYDGGAGDGEIKIGNLTIRAGWAGAYGAVARAEAAYFRMINDGGGIKGRKIKFISVDGGSDPAKAVDLARELVEREGVLLIFSSIGTASNLAIRAYMNERKVPQLFVESSSAAFGDPLHFPWTMGFFATYRTEGLVYANYILRNKPLARIAVLYAKGEAGKEYLGGVHEGLAGRASAVMVKEESYEAWDATLDPQLRALKNSKADVFINLSTGAFATKAIRRAYEIDWHPLQFIPNASLSIAAFLDPAGLEAAEGIISNARSKSWVGTRAQSDPAVREFLDWMRKYNPGASLRDQNNVAGYERAQALVEVLRKCGDDLTRANVMKQASHLDLALGMLRPGIRIKTSPEDYQPIKQLYLIRFNGRNWIPIGPATSDREQLN
jgi:branched-chain amino acid transport system substrate-binding protein